jgi:branched-chain amino acid transport system ATP-binding protein
VEQVGSLRATAVDRSFDGIHALSGVSIEVHKGELVGLIGPNGAGKSTLVNLLSGFDSPTSGTVHLGAEDVTRWRPSRRSRIGLSRTFQHGHSFRGLTVRENVEVAALGMGTSARKARLRATGLLKLVGMFGEEHLGAGTLPQGKERLLGVARALATMPSFLLLDEPAAGLNEQEATEFGEMLDTVRGEMELGLLLIDHNVGLVMSMSDRLHVLDEGTTIAEGTPSEIRNDETVTAAYLGLN